MSIGSDRMLVQNSLPMVDIVLPDGSTVPGINIKGQWTIVSNLPTVVRATVENTTAAYADGDAVGGMLTFEDAAYDETHLGVTVDSLILSDIDKVKGNYDLIIFDRQFTPTLDQSDFDPSDDDLLNIIGVVEIRTADYYEFVDNAIAVITNIGLNMVLNGTDLYAQLVVASGAPDFVNTDALQVTLGIRRD